jgi:hypothetical protein
MLTFVNILLTGILCLSDFPSNIIKKCAAGFFAQNLEIAAFASQNEKRTFFAKKRSHHLKNGHLFLSFFLE